MHIQHHRYLDVKNFLAKSTKTSEKISNIEERVNKMQNYLTSHNINATIHHIKESKSLSTPDIIFESVKSSQSDLLVMGGYGHLRLTEMLLGGVSHQVLKESPVAIFISH